VAKQQVRNENGGSGKTATRSGTSTTAGKPAWRDDPISKALDPQKSNNITLPFDVTNSGYRFPVHPSSRTHAMPKPRPIPVLALALSFALPAISAAEQHLGDIQPWLENGKVMLNGTLFEGDFGDLSGGVYGTDDPGYDADSAKGAFGTGNWLWFEGLGSLKYWNGSAWAGGVPNGEHVELEDALGNLTAIGADGVSNPWGVIGQFDADGDLHMHLDMAIRNAGNALGGTIGAYWITLRLLETAPHGGNPVSTPSDPFHVIFNRGLSTEKFQAAVVTAATRNALPPLLDYYIGRDGLETLGSGKYAGHANPNLGRLTLLFNRGRGFRGIGTFSYAGPPRSPVPVSTSANNRLPEKSSRQPPSPLTLGMGFPYLGKLVSNPSDAEYSRLPLGSVQALRNAKPGREAHTLFHSSNDRWTPAFPDAVIALQLVSKTAGLHVGTDSRMDVLEYPGDFVILGKGKSAKLKFNPVFWTESAAASGTYSVELRLLDLNPNPEKRVKPSGTFNLDFQVP
jgi:hypothetical protein